MLAGLIYEKSLSKAFEAQKVQKKKLGNILIDMGVADDETIARALAGQLDIPLFRLKEMEIKEDIISMVPS